MNIKIISEDDNGGAFLKNVILQLKNKKLVGNISVKGSKPMRPLCNFKLDRILKSFDGSCDKIIIMLDSDGTENLESRHVNVMRHKPDELKNQYGYIKSSLPKYASELDFDKLQRNCRSFKAFLNALTL